MKVCVLFWKYSTAPEMVPTPKFNDPQPWNDRQIDPEMIPK